MDIRIGDIVVLKKQHPCGSKEWKVIRTGVDIKMKCLGCNHLVMLPRTKLEKRIKEIKRTE